MGVTQPRFIVQRAVCTKRPCTRAVIMTSMRENSSGWRSTVRVVPCFQPCGTTSGYVHLSSSWYNLLVYRLHYSFWSVQLCAAYLWFQSNGLVASTPLYRYFCSSYGIGRREDPDLQWYSPSCVLILTPHGGLFCSCEPCIKGGFFCGVFKDREWQEQRRLHSLSAIAK